MVDFFIVMALLTAFICLIYSIITRDKEETLLAFLFLFVFGSDLNS